MTAGAATLERGRWHRAWEAIDERLGLSGLAYPVPAHANGIGYILGGISFFGFLIIANSYVVGAVIGDVVVPAFAERRVGSGGLALAVAALLGLSLLRIASIWARRLGAGFMQFRLQARYRRAVTRRYLSLPPEWHQRHATGALLSNAGSDVEAAFAPIAPLPFAVGTIVMIAGAVVALFLTDWVLALVGVGTFFAQATATGFVGRAATADRGAAGGLYLACYFLGGLVGTALLGQLFDRLGWAACVAGIGAALALAAWLAKGLRLPPQATPS